MSAPLENGNAVKRVDPLRAKLREHLKASDLSETKIAALIGVNKRHLCSAMKAEKRTFQAYRYRMRVERELKVLIWTDALETAEIRQIGERLHLDLLTADLAEIRRKAWKANVRPMELHNGRPTGYGCFRSLITFFFPQSEALKAPHYVQLHS